MRRDCILDKNISLCCQSGQAEKINQGADEVESENAQCTLSLCCLLKHPAGKEARDDVLLRGPLPLVEKVIFVTIDEEAAKMTRGVGRHRCRRIKTHT